MACSFHGVLFLLNQSVIDLGVLTDTLIACGLDPIRAPSLARVAAAGQEAAFASSDFAAGHPNLGRSIAAQVVQASDANCALFLTPPGARSPREVAVRFACAPLTTMGHLLSAQQRCALTPALINAHVWRLVGAHAPA